MKLIDKGVLTTIEEIIRFVDDDRKEWFLCVKTINGKFDKIEPLSICNVEFNMLPPLKRNTLMDFAAKQTAFYIAHLAKQANQVNPL